MDRTTIKELMSAVVESMNHQDKTIDEFDSYGYRLTMLGDSIDDTVVAYLYYPSGYESVPREMTIQELEDLERYKSNHNQKELDNYIMYNFGI